MGRSVILAEDDDDLREVLAASLEGAGYDVHEASDGEGVLEAVASIPDAILVDVLLPDFHGLDVLVALRCGGWDTPVIFMTGLGGDHLSSFRAVAEAWGAAVVLQKPFTLDALDMALFDARRASQSGIRATRAPAAAPF